MSRVIFGKSFLTPKLIIDRKISVNNTIVSRRPIKSFKSTLKYGEFSVLPSHYIPDYIIKPPYGILSCDRELKSYYTRECTYAEVKSSRQILHMRKAARIAADCLKLCVESTEIGKTAEDIDRIGHDFIIKSGAYPAGIKFHGFPKAICVSVNEVACHGIPNLRPFKDGDIASYDCTVYIDGVYGDCAATVAIGNVSSEVKKLVDVSKECLYKAIECVRPNVKFSRLAQVVTEYAEKNGFSVIREFGGHFIGEMMHMPPMIQFRHPSSTPGVMEAGQTFTIEPIICRGDPSVYTWKDGWTVATCDNGFCSQFEHTVLVTGDGCEILTLPSN